MCDVSKNSRDYLRNHVCAEFQIATVKTPGRSARNPAPGPTGYPAPRAPSELFRLPEGNVLGSSRV